ncbi:MAG: DUF1987 domain-containing protein [Bacteroidales bacterium]|nr:DUF1987 domain-containing protein [Bacteroidales bacterium]
MKDLRIEGTKYTPEIIFDCTNKHFSISGNSRPENADAFFKEVFNWFEINGEEVMKLDAVGLIIDLEYFNSSSSKQILNILYKLEYLNPNNTVIKWYYDDEDEEILDAGKEFEEVTSLSFEFHKKR